MPKNKSILRRIEVPEEEDPKKARLETEVNDVNNSDKNDPPLSETHSKKPALTGSESQSSLNHCKNNKVEVGGDKVNLFGKKEEIFLKNNNTNYCGPKDEKNDEKNNNQCETENFMTIDNTEPRLCVTVGCEKIKCIEPCFTNIKYDPNSENCHICNQNLNIPDVIYYQGHPQGALKELTINKKLFSVAGNEEDFIERPNIKLTEFSIYDQHGHLCSIDSGFNRKEVRLYACGYLNPIGTYLRDVDQKSFPVKDVGPITEWYIHRCKGGKKTRITLSTQFAEYQLMRPSNEYMLFMTSFYEKLWLTKVVVEYLEESYYFQPNCSYKNLLEVIRNSRTPDLKLTEEILQKHAQFLCDQVRSLEVDENSDHLIKLPCMRELIRLIDVNFPKEIVPIEGSYKTVDRKAWSKATTTPLVRKTFENFFPEQLDESNHEFVSKRKRCEICEACQQPDCGECRHCRAMAKFGGHGLSKKDCVRRHCPNMTEDSEQEDEDGIEYDSEDTDLYKRIGINNRTIKWIGEPVQTDASKIYYENVKLDNAELFQVGDYVTVATALPSMPCLVTRVVYMWKETSNARNFNPRAGYFHGQVLMRSSDTILGEVGHPREVFMCNKCVHGVPLSSILCKAYVERKEISKDWFKLGGKDIDEDTFEDNGKTYYYSKFYDRFTARFEDMPEDPACPNQLRIHRYCASCERKSKKDAKLMPKVIGKTAFKTEVYNTEWRIVKWKDYEYKKGSGVFLKPQTFRLKNSLKNDNILLKQKIDETIYTEYYRKGDNSLRGSNEDTKKPFCIGYIAAVIAKRDDPLVDPEDIYLKVNILYRPENTSNRFPHHEDVNMVYWSDDIVEVPFSAVVGPCNLIYEKNIPNQDNIYEWLEKDPKRFYFRKAYNRATEKVVDVPVYATSVGSIGTGEINDEEILAKLKTEQQNTVKAKVRPLRTLDVFAGCGGLSAGLHEAGVADCRWAVENLGTAAQAYALNNKKCTVFHEDCNTLLRDVMAGVTHSTAGQRLPMQGEVELLCGGPPCQGFSGMNRFNSREYSNFKNSLVVAFLSYCDYYRPKYFVLENVRNFAAFKHGMVLKLTLRALLAMGYQCTFGVLQAGNYGVPQTRRRLVVLAAAPGWRLPLYPEPTHAFSLQACSLHVVVDRKRFVTNVIWEESAPRRTVMVRDAMSDLPEIQSGASELEMEYGSVAASYFQRRVRCSDEDGKLRDHVCKKMAPIVQARIDRIPTAPGSDWRDLPNIAVNLSDGTKSKVLQYKYEDAKMCTFLRKRRPRKNLFHKTHRTNLPRKNAGEVLSYARRGRPRKDAPHFWPSEMSSCKGRPRKATRDGPRGVCACAAGGKCSRDDKQDNTLIPWCLPHTANRHNHWAGLYGRLAWDGYFSTTVTDPEPMGKQGRVLHPEQPRVVSVRECARSQGFPDSYRFVGSVLDKHRQIGNAVPPPLAAAIGREIKLSIIASKYNKKK